MTKKDYKYLLYYKDSDYSFYNILNKEMIELNLQDLPSIGKGFYYRVISSIEKEKEELHEELLRVEESMDSAILTLKSSIEKVNSLIESSFSQHKENYSSDIKSGGNVSIMKLSSIGSCKNSQNGYTI